MKSKSRNIYMHLMDEKPAYLDAGQSLVYAGRIFPASGFCDSLAELKRQRRQSMKWRLQNYPCDRDDAHYNYLRIVLPNGNLANAKR